MASEWKVPIAGAHPVTGSAENILQPSVLQLSRVTTNKFPHWRVSGNSYLKTSFGQSMIHGICMQVPGRLTVRSAIFNSLWKNVTGLQQTLRTLYAKPSLPITKTSVPNSKVLPRLVGLLTK